MGEWLDDCLAFEDNRDTWTQFTHQFLAAFADTQRDQRARNQLETLRMKWPEIDQYTMDFERLLREASYQKGTPECAQMYLKGLPDSVIAQVVSPPLCHTYAQMVVRATKHVKAQEMRAAIRALKGPRTPSRQGGWQNFGTNCPQRPPNPPNTQNCPFNSSTAPRVFNNVPVPMDVGRTQGNRQGPRRGRFQNNVASISTPTKGNCFNCGQPGHFAQTCPEKKKTRAAVAQESWRTEDGREETLLDWPNQTSPPSRIDAAMSAFTALSQEERDTIASNIRGEEEQNQDFQNA
jgi:hypothetical protein